MTQVILWLEDLQNVMQAIGFSLAAVCVIALAILLLTGGTQGMQKGKSMAIGILVAVGLLSFGTALVATLQG